MQQGTCKKEQVYMDRQKKRGRERSELGRTCLYSSGSISDLAIQFNISKSYQDPKKLSYTRRDIGNAIRVLALGFTDNTKVQWGSAISTLFGITSEAVKSFGMEKHISVGLNITNVVQHVPSDRLVRINKSWSKISKSIRSGQYNFVLRYEAVNGTINENVTKFSAGLTVAVINSKDGSKKERYERQKGKKDRGKRKRKDDDDEREDTKKKKGRTLNMPQKRKGNQAPGGNAGEHRTFALGNVLLSKNNLYLSADISGISQERLLSFVAERLIDSNSNVDNKDAGCVENQKRNIDDAIDLLSLTTGIDVNIKFKGITEFEIKRECAIFDLLDISLYHGWIVDPQLGGQLYLLATDRGYINQPDLVWEKLNEDVIYCHDMQLFGLFGFCEMPSNESCIMHVNGNTVFMTGSCEEYHTNNTWDEQNARAADYLASIDDSAQDNSSCNLDLQLAMPFQEQKFYQQPQRNRQQQIVAGGSWLVTGPKDSDTCIAIGSESYNAIMGDLVALEIGTVGSEFKKKPEESSIDFIAATTATLGVPYSGLSRVLSFNNSTGAVFEHNKSRKGDIEEEAKLLRAMKKSEAEVPASSKDVYPYNSDEQNVFTISKESEYIRKSEVVVSVETTGGNVGVEVQKSSQQEPSISSDSNDEDMNNGGTTFETIPEKHNCLSSKNHQKILNSQSSLEKKDAGEKPSIGCLDLQEALVSDSCEPDPLSTAASSANDFEGTKQVQDQSVSKPYIQEEDNQSAPETLNSACSTVDAELDSFGDSTRNRDVVETVTPGGDGPEPIYAGEECILEPGWSTSYEGREPVYEGEVVLAEQVDKNSSNAREVACKNEITPQQELIKDFLKTNASQLTVHGLICSQEEVKERELCVFFRNNPFYTMFKLGGQLYVLSTDQGYINQADLVNEVNGNTMFMTGNFKEFKAADHTNNTWDEQNASASTSDYLASIDDSALDNSNISSGLQLAMARQEQNF